MFPNLKPETQGKAGRKNGLFEDGMEARQTNGWTEPSNWMDPAKGFGYEKLESRSNRDKLNDSILRWLGAIQLSKWCRPIALAIQPGLPKAIF